MPKIKNWSRRRSVEVGDTNRSWMNTTTRNPYTVQVHKFGSKWYVDVNENERGGPRDVVTKKFDNVEDARKWAIKWMKNNPRP